MYIFIYVYITRYNIQSVDLSLHLKISSLQFFFRSPLGKKMNTEFYVCNSVI